MLTNLESVTALNIRMSISSKEDQRPYIKLLVAVLARAACDYVSVSTSKEKYAKRDAYFWLTSPEECEWSYLWVCEHLDICPHRVLKTILSFTPEKDTCLGKGLGVTIYTSAGLDTLLANMLESENKWNLFC